jgi:hypothetical protein
VFFPSVCLNHPGGVESGMDMAVKLALTDRAIALSTDALKEHQAHRRGFLLFLFSTKLKKNRFFLCYYL